MEKYKKFIENLGYAATEALVAEVEKRHFDLLTPSVVDSAFVMVRESSASPFATAAQRRKKARRARVGAPEDAK